MCDVGISFISQMGMNCLTLDFNDIQDFDVELQVLQQCMQKQKVQT